LVVGAEAHSAGCGGACLFAPAPSPSPARREGDKGVRAAKTHCQTAFRGRFVCGVCAVSLCREYIRKKSRRAGQELHGASFTLAQALGERTLSLR
jgi:hypothetical protein